MCGSRGVPIQGRAGAGPHTSSPLGASSKVQSSCRSEGAERTRSGTGQQTRMGHPAKLPQPLPASLLPRAGAQGLSHGPKNVPREGRN